MFEKIKSLIAEQLFIDGKEIKEESKFIDDLGRTVSTSYSF